MIYITNLSLQIFQFLIPDSKGIFISNILFMIDFQLLNEGVVNCNMHFDMFLDICIFNSCKYSVQVSVCDKECLISLSVSISCSCHHHKEIRWKDGHFSPNESFCQ